jgi:hypothetical protein
MGAETENISRCKHMLWNLRKLQNNPNSGKEIEILGWENQM